MRSLLISSENSLLKTLLEPPFYPLDGRTYFLKFLILIFLSTIPTIWVPNVLVTKILDPVHLRRKDNFIKFMYKLLDVTLRDVPRIRKFHLDLGINYDFDEKTSFENGFSNNESNNHVNKWVSAALRLDVSCLWFSSPTNFNVTPENIFSCASLVEIMLYWNASICLPKSVNLPNLKCLCLKQVLFHDDDLRILLSGCPVLEELCLGLCQFSQRKIKSDNPHVVRISSPSVKSFKWFNCVNNGKYGMELDMPALNSLTYDNFLPEYFLVNNLNSLRKAYINAAPGIEQLESFGLGHRVHYLKNVIDIVVGCSNVEFLCLSDQTIEALSCSFNSLSPFYNLIELELCRLCPNGWKLLPYLLKNAPNLEILVFSMGFRDYEGCYKLFLSHAGQCPTTLLALSNLQRIRFERFDGEIDEINLVKYFLENAKVLRKIEISFSFLCEEKLIKAASKVEALQKRSKKCHIELIFGEEGNESNPAFSMREFK